MGANNILKKVPDEVDGRQKDSIKFRDIVNSTILLSGDHCPPQITEQIAKQYAALVIRQEQHQLRLFGGDGRGTSDHAYVKLVNAANRCLKLLGLLGSNPEGDEGDVMALERYCATKGKALARKSTRKKDRRRERLGR